MTTKAEALRRFDLSHKDIVKEYGRNSVNARTSLIGKEIYNLTSEFSIINWKKMRANNYWPVIDSIKSLYEKKLFTLNRVKEYIDSFNKQP